MRRRLGAIAGALALTLLIPASLASADTTGPGLFLNTESETLCDGYFCTTTRIEMITFEGDSLALCVELRYTNLELGGVEMYREMGCTGAIGGISGGVTMSKGGFLVGFGTTHMDLDNTLNDDNRSIHISASYVVTSAIEKSSQVIVVPDSPDPGCTSTHRETARSVNVTGTFFVGSTLPAGGAVTEFDGTGVSTDVAWRTKVRC